MEKMKKLLSQMVKFFPYAFMLTIAGFIGYWSKNWFELIVGMILFDLVTIYYELWRSEKLESEEKKDEHFKK